MISKAPWAEMNRSHSVAFLAENPTFEVADSWSCEVSSFSEWFYQFLNLWVRQPFEDACVGRDELAPEEIVGSGIFLTCYEAAVQPHDRILHA
jgi:hypothetical protein